MAVANTEVQLQALKALERGRASVEKTGAPGDEASMLKIVSAEVQQTLGPCGLKRSATTAYLSTQSDSR